MKPLECPCGNSNLIAEKITLVLFRVPFVLTEDGPEYDDHEAEYSEGWDFNQETRCRCASCGTVYDITTDDKARQFLEQMAQEG